LRPAPSGGYVDELGARRTAQYSEEQLRTARHNRLSRAVLLWFKLLDRCGSLDAHQRLKILPDHERSGDALARSSSGLLGAACAHIACREDAWDRPLKRLVGLDEPFGVGFDPLFEGLAVRAHPDQHE